MNTYADTLAYLYGLEYRGMKFGLRNIRSLLRYAGQPQLQFPSIHIAGTNGKGSTASFLASIFMEGGYCTGLYTSPHLVRFTERIRIDGKEISEKRLVDYVEELRPAIERVRATFFEATTAVAFRYFADEGVDIAVIEAGLGGRLDATNVLAPCVSVITNIALEHEAYLGKTLRSIAKEKGGIIKPGVPVVTASTDQGVLTVLRGIAGRRRAQFFEAAGVVKLIGTDGFVGPHFGLRRVRLGLRGEHQRVNAQLALAALAVLGRRPGRGRQFRNVNPRIVRAGLANVRGNTGLRGRLQSLGHGVSTLLDVAHNPAAMKRLADALEGTSKQGYVVVMGAMKDKDTSGMLTEIGRIARLVIMVAPATKRAQGAGRLHREARRLGINSVIGGTVRQGLRRARRSSPVLVTGSHYVVGEALQILTKNKT